jgi:UDP-glucose 4-epimerase
MHQSFSEKMNLGGSHQGFVTGGAGFIGSHMVDRLARACTSVTDVLDGERLKKEMAGCDIVFHFQANADVRGGTTRTQIDLQQNTIATWNVLEAMRINEVKHIVFASSATVYGEPDVFPTPETYAPLQTSLYGASKLACEAMIQAYCEYFGIRCHIFRFVSWIGERYSHGVVFDFVSKLKSDPRTLEVLGDGKQRKSYLDVVDGVDGIFHALEHAKEAKNVFNLGHDASMNVLDLADIVVDELNLKGVRYVTTGGERGWLGDSPFVHLDTTKLKTLGWRPRVTIEQGIRNTVQYLQSHPQLLKRSA